MIDGISAELGKLFGGQPFGWNNAVDILIVAIFVYYLLVLIRGTRAVQLLLGVVVLVVIYGIAVLLDLRLTTLVLQAIFALALVAVPIIFQPELRRALGQIGRLGPLNRLLASTTDEELDTVVGELVRASLLISAARHGALIVVERGTGLQDYSETGVPVNGRLTAELLASIFMLRSPLHDGAVIVRGPQILAAACLLPLEESGDRAAHRYGMRHRAALSISAQTDAIVVVVSEETQAISIASNGRMIGSLDEERLRRVLSSLLRSRIEPLPFRRKGPAAGARRNPLERVTQAIRRGRPGASH
ncbi:MAG: diadenylate cyclase CdaA [Candidatus Limnocylindria bacterium]